MLTFMAVADQFVFAPQGAWLGETRWPAAPADQFVYNPQELWEPAARWPAVQQAGPRRMLAARHVLMDIGPRRTP